MSQFNIIHSNDVYQTIIHDLDTPEEKNAYLKSKLLEPFKEKFEIQHIPFDQPINGFDVISFYNSMHIAADALNSSHLPVVEQFNDSFWEKCENGMQDAIDYFENHDVHPTVETYTFSAFLGDAQKPAMSLNNNYSGDGGIPGYLFISLVPNDYTLARVKSAVAHEMNHNIRYQFVQWDGGSLAELIVSEGLAENFVETLYGSDVVGPWAKNVDEATLKQKVKPIIKEHLDINNLFEAMPYLYGDDMTIQSGGRPVGLPHAAGYTCGYYLVKYFLEHTQTPIHEATQLSASDILSQVEDFWND